MASVPSPHRSTLSIDDRTVSTLLVEPGDTRAVYVLAHGAGAGMEHPFMGEMATALAKRGIATFRYNFPYLEGRRGRIDPKPLLHATVRAAVRAAADALPGVPLFAGGKSMGGRMTSEAQAEEPLPGARGMAFLGFPLHPPKRPGTERAVHLEQVTIPMLFLQGTRDDLADLELICGVASSLGERAMLSVVEGADHSFHVLKRSGRSDAEVLDDLAIQIDNWCGASVLFSG